MKVLQFISGDGVVDITISTNDITEPWKRFTRRVDRAEAERYCEYRSSLNGELKLVGSNGVDGEMLSKGEKMNVWKGLYPVVYETRKYNIVIRFKDIQGEAKIEHKLKEVTDSFESYTLKDNTCLLTGTLDFLNEPGDFDLSYHYKTKDGVTHRETFGFSVVSPKLDIKKDGMEMMRTINQVYNEMVFKYLTKTFLHLSRGKVSNNDLIWLEIFKEVVDEYLQAIQYLINKPHNTLVHEVNYDKADRIKRWSPRMVERYEEKCRQGNIENYLFRHEVVNSTNNTQENRFVKFTLDRIGERLNDIMDSMPVKIKKEVSQDEWETMMGYQEQLNRLKYNPLFRNLRAEPIRNNSLVLQKKTGYAQVYRSWLALQCGMELYNGSSAIGVRPIWELYELWCFLKMSELVKEIVGMEDEEYYKNLGGKQLNIDPFVENNSSYSILYTYEEDKIELGYQHTFGRGGGEIHTETTENRPDIILRITKPNGFVLTYLFDAKYRVIDDDSMEDEDRLENEALGTADYPPPDALNQMHRYRDAIYYGNGNYSCTAKEVIGGYILFPGRGNDKSVEERYYSKSIKRVNIGAFPLLPGEECTLLRQHLTQIITNQGAYEQIKDSIPQKGLKYHAVTDDVKILVGYYKNLEKLLLVRNAMMYNVRVGNVAGSVSITEDLLNAKYLLLYNKNDRYLYELDQEGPKIWSRQEVEKVFDKTWADIKSKYSGISEEGKLAAMPNEDHNMFMIFKLKSDEEVVINGVDKNRIELRQGKNGYDKSPYVISLSDILR